MENAYAERKRDAVEEDVTWAAVITKQQVA